MLNLKTASPNKIIQALVTALYFPIFLLIAFPGQALSQSAQEKTLVLSIGINQYSNPYWRPLNYAQKDASDFVAALKDRVDQSWLLTGEQSHSGSVGKGEILRALGELSTANSSERDVVIVFVSSHGTVGRVVGDSGAKSIEKFLVTSDTEPKYLEETGISHKSIFGIFNSLKSRRKVIIFDSCYSGTGKSKLTESMLQQLASQKSDFLKEPEDDFAEGTMVLSASAWGEEAVENSQLANGVYTHFLIKGFDQDFNQDGAVSITEAHQFATQSVIKFTGNTQHPTAKIEVVGQDPIIVNGEKKSESSPILYAYDWIMRSFTVEVNGKSLGNMSKGGLIMPKGKHRLVVKDESGTNILDRFVDFQAGREYPLSAFLYYKPRYFISLGLGQSFISNQNLQSSLFPASYQTISLRFERREMILQYTGILELEISPKITSKIDSGATQVEQKSSSSSLSLSLGKEIPLAFLSGKRVDSFLVFGPSVGYRFFNRDIQDDAFLDKDQDLGIPSIGGFAGSKTLFRRIQSSLDISFRTWLNYNNSKIGSNTYASYEAKVLWGWHW
ncbi:MAG: caspase family protein [Pseudobacteriovorax sp.]|nr:caspase family protein [Pseudobacteriovorax sp.]